MDDLGALQDRQVRRARKRLDGPVFDYLSEGSFGGVTAGEAVASWDRLRLRPRVLRDVTAIDLAVELAGTPSALPVGVAPTTLQRAADPRGEVAMAEGVAAHDGLLVVSSNAGSTFEDIASTGVRWWLQMYVTSDRTVTAPVVDRALAAGATAVVLTADTPVVGPKRHRGASVLDTVPAGWLRANFPDGTAGSEKATDLGPQDIAWLANRFGVPVVVKGVLHPEDARRCVDAGARAVWVSNHGGRQLDHVVDTSTALGPIADEVGTDAQVYVDGGLQRGVHALAAFALGADAVFVGRPALWALAAGGAGGVAELLAAWADELRTVLRLAGCDTPGGVPRDTVVSR